MSIDAREPPGGDFVAYIEQLERAQALRHAVPGTMAAPAKAPANPTPSQSDSATAAQPLLSRLTAGGQAGPSLVAILVGVGLVIGGGAMNAGPVPFFLGLAAIMWGTRRLERLRKSKS